MRNLTRWTGAAALALAIVLPLGAARAATTATTTRVTAATAAAACAIDWGSLAKQAGTSSTSATLTNVRAGRNDCYDRVVLDGASWARVGYVDQVYQDGSGQLVPLRGGARLQIVTSRADNVNTGAPTYTPANPKELVDVTGWPTFRQIAFAGDFEGQTTLGLGVRARLPFRILVLASAGQPPRTVVDVAHQW
jgi:hypothetical protein